MLEIENLHVAVDGKQILKGITLKLEKGLVHTIMGPNGSGKSTLAQVILGHPRYDILEGSITYDGKNVLEMEPNERAKAGLFLCFQYPMEIPGVTITNFLRSAYKETKDPSIGALAFRDILVKKCETMGISKEFIRRYLNEGFSGGEKKKMEILQMAVLDPTFAIIDEVDSGLDIDALKIVATGINHQKEKGAGILLITHYQRILEYVKPDRVHIIVDGKVQKSGGFELVEELEKRGYKWVTESETQVT